ncbi:MAG: hypothetical protein ACQSGP_27785, partial [Frankia sp.]
TGTTGTAGAAKILVCPTGSDHQSSGDVAIIALVGVLGAGASAVGAISTVRHFVDPYWTPIHQGLLKVPLGAIAAVLGVVSVEAGLEGGAGGATSQGGLLLLAFVLGYSQQLLTRIVDTRGSQVREGLSGERSHRWSVPDASFSRL